MRKNVRVASGCPPRRPHAISSAIASALFQRGSSRSRARSLQLSPIGKLVGRARIADQGGTEGQLSPATSCREQVQQLREKISVYSITSSAIASSFGHGAQKRTWPPRPTPRKGRTARIYCTSVA